MTQLVTVKNIKLMASSPTNTQLPQQVKTKIQKLVAHTLENRADVNCRQITLDYSLPAGWEYARFWKSKHQKGVFVLSGIPSICWNVVTRRLWSYGAKYVAAGSPLSSKGTTIWIAIQCNSELGAYLASKFPAPEGAEQLIIGKHGKLLAGTAEKHARTAIKAGFSQGKKLQPVPVKQVEVLSE